MLLCCLSGLSHSLVAVIMTVKSSGKLQCLIKGNLALSHTVEVEAIISKCGRVGKPDFGSVFTFSINSSF
jgi:hypothetical protein